MMTILIAAAVLAEVTTGSSMAGPAELGEVETIVVEGRRLDRDWAMPKLEYDVPENCPALLETEIPGFGALRIAKICAGDRTEEWRPSQH